MTSAARLVIRGARVVTLAGGAVPRRGREAMRELSVMARADVAIGADGRIVAVGKDLNIKAEETIEADGRVLLPGFVDCHTHACWAGNRLDEFARRLAGEEYLSILDSGGGIMSTVRAVRAASVEALAAALEARLQRMFALGTTTAEVKTGYGLTVASELKMLEAIGIAAGRVDSRMRVVPTFLGAHAIDREQEDFARRTIQETLPAAAMKCPGIVCDAYCEEGAWSLAETRAYFERATAMGCPIRVHSDQFHSLGATGLAIQMGARSVDHLEAVSDADVTALGRAKETGAVILPACGYHLGGKFAPGRALVDAGAAVAVATNLNPGSAPTPSMPFAMATACRYCALTCEEAITAATVNAAWVLRMHMEVGTIEVGKRGDVVLWDERDERAIAFEFAGVPAAEVVCGGRRVKH